MRPISADLLNRIQALNQTIYGNADPKMLATIIKAITDLDIFTIAEGEVLGKNDQAAQISAVNSAPDAIWLAQVINHEAVIKVYTLLSAIEESERPSMLVIKNYLIVTIGHRGI